MEAFRHIHSYIMAFFGFFFFFLRNCFTLPSTLPPYTHIYMLTYTVDSLGYKLFATMLGMILFTLDISFQYQRPGNINFLSSCLGTFNFFLTEFSVSPFYPSLFLQNKYLYFSIAINKVHLFSMICKPLAQKIISCKNISPNSSFQLHLLPEPFFLMYSTS